jgi:hypothetical protein
MTHPRGPESPRWVGDLASYETVHRRLGNASQHRCVDCGGGAAEWSYIGGDPNEKCSAKGYRYSVDLSYYVPRCRSCHQHFDPARTKSPSGVRGVHWNKSCGKWQAIVKHKGKVYYLGLFTNITEAEDAVVTKRNELGGD